MTGPGDPISAAASRDGRASGRAWLAVGLLWGAALSCYLTRNLFVAMHGSIEAAIPMTETQFGLLTSVFLWFYATCNPIGGLVADRFNRSGVIIASLLAWSAATLLTARATTFREVLVLRAVMGVSQACFLPSSSALVTDYHRGTTRSLAVGLLMSGLMIGATLGGLSGRLAETHDWSYAFVVFGVPSLALGLALIFLLRDPPREAGPGGAAAATIRPVAALLTLLGTGSVLAVVGCSMIQNAVSWIVIGWMPTYMHEHFHLGQGAAGISATAYVFVTQTVVLILAGLWTDRWSRTFARARIWVPVIGLCLVAPSFWLAGRFVLLGTTIACLCLWGVAVGFLGSNLMPILCLVTDRRYRATAYGLINSAGSAAGGLAILVTGAMRDSGVDLSRGLVFAGAGCLVAAALLLTIRARPGLAGG